MTEKMLLAERAVEINSAAYDITKIIVEHHSGNLDTNSCFHSIENELKRIAEKCYLQGKIEGMKEVLQKITDANEEKSLKNGG